MIGNFRFKSFLGGILITNDAGEFCFLLPEEWKLFSHGILPENRSSELIAKHFWISGDQENYIRSMINQIQANRAYLFQPTSLYILAITNRCNNACIYCQAHGNQPCIDMSPETAQLIIDRIAETPSKKLSIEFQGGEPLCNFETIKAVMEYAPKRLENKKVDFNLVSNLSLLSDKIADYIVDHHISVSTSLDGPKHLHEKNRPALGKTSSYHDTIRGINFLRNKGIDVGAIETTTRQSLPYGKEIVDSYLENGLHSIFLRPLTRLGEAAKHWDEIGYSSKEFIEFYSNTLDYIVDLNISGKKIIEQHASIFLDKMLGGFSPNYMELRSPCGAGIGQIAFTSTGNVYTCDEGRMLAEAGDESFLLGNIKNSNYDDWMECPTCKAVLSASLLETLPGCCDCVYQPYCGVCPVANFAMTGNLYKATNNDRCEIYRGIIDKLMSIILKGTPEMLDVLKSWVQW